MSLKCHKPWMSMRAKAHLEAHKNVGYQMPHHVLIVYSSLYCSGALIASRIVMTSASCFVKWSPKVRVLVKLGTESMLGTGQIFNVDEVKIHEYYQYRAQLDNDIALAVLDEHASFGPNIKKAIFMSTETKVKEGDSLSLSVWSKSDITTTHESYIKILQLRVMSREVCASTLGPLKTHSNYCAYYKTQPKDIGGAALYQGRIAGVLAFTGNNGTTTNFAVLTNVTYFHKWLHLNIRRLLVAHCTDPEPISWYDLNES